MRIIQQIDRSLCRKSSPASPGHALPLEPLPKYDFSPVGCVGWVALQRKTLRLDAARRTSEWCCCL